MQLGECVTQLMTTCGATKEEEQVAQKFVLSIVR